MLGHRELTIDDYLAILRRRFWILLVLAILGASSVYIYSRTLPNQYQSHTVVMVEQPKVSRQFVTPVGDEQINQRLENMTEQILSPMQLEPVVEQFHVYEKQFPGSSSKARASLLQSAITISPIQAIVDSHGEGIPGFKVNVTLYNPELAQEICQQITSMLLQENTSWQTQTAQDTTSFLSKQIADAKQALDEQDAKLTAFKLRFLGKLPDEAQTNIEVLGSLNSQLEAATAAVNRTQQNKIYLESQLTQQLAAWKATRSGNNALTLEEQLANLQNKLMVLRTRYTDQYPDVVKMKSEIAQLQKKIDAANATSDAGASTQPSAATPAYAEPAQIQQLRQEIRQYDETIQEDTKEQASLQKKIDAYQARVQMSPVVDQQYTELTRNYQTALDFYRGLLTKKAQADMGADLQQSQQAESFRVIDPATISGVPIGPRRPLYAGGGAMMGLFFGIAIALWLELRDKSIRTERDVEFYLQAPTLALVPLMPKQRDTARKQLPAAVADTANHRLKALQG